jgi:hypothetical protein
MRKALSTTAIKELIINCIRAGIMITAALSYIDSMTPPGHNLSASGRQLALVGASSADQLPRIFLGSEHAGKRFWEFFTADIRNRNSWRTGRDPSPTPTST